MNVEVQWLRTQVDAFLPTQAYDSDAGWDFYALEDVKLPPVPMVTWVRTGIKVAIPGGFYGRFVARSSTTEKGLSVVEGIIDAGYRGELQIRVIPLWLPPATITRGDKLAQLIVSPVPRVTMRHVSKLPRSDRGLSGFGSSGAAAS